MATSMLWDLDPLQIKTPLWTKWAQQLDPQSQRATWSSWSQPTYTYGVQPQQSVEYDPLPRGQMYETLGQTFGFLNTTDAGIDTWLQQTYPDLYSYNGDVGAGTNAGSMATLGGDWSTVDRWDDMVRVAVGKVATETGTYVPTNLVKAIMRVESGGMNGTGAGTDSPAGAIGLMQVMPMWGTTFGLNLRDPQQNIEAGVRVLLDGYKSGDMNGQPSWEWAARRYLGLGGPDAFGTDNNEYWDRVSGYLNDLNAGVQYGQTHGTTAAKGTTQIRAIWGGFDAPISQEYGWTQFARESGGYYNYGADYTRDRQPMGHPGIDVGIVRNTPLYAPLGGVVQIAGNTPYYTFYGNGGPQIGELLIHMTNGDEYILGHMKDITVRVGDTVTPGQFVGYSGGENGDHVHVEYRRWVGAGITNSGWEQTDPREALKGNFVGSYGQSAASGARTAAPVSNWNWFLRAAMTGAPIATFSSQPGFHENLRDLLAKIGAPGGAPGGSTADQGPPTSWLIDTPKDPFNPEKKPTTPTGGATPTTPTP